MDMLPSWNDGRAKRSIVDFIERTTSAGNPDFVPEPDRIAVFDNDGTLWVEQPMYTQLAFLLSDVRAVAPEHPDWKVTEPFRSVLEGNLAGLGAAGEAGIMTLFAATQCNMSTTAFAEKVQRWIASARHPKFDCVYTDLVYQPMLEVLAYFNIHGFKTYIVTGGGADFVRPWSPRVYGVPPEQIVGSSLKTRFDLIDGRPTLTRIAEVNLIDDGPGKPVGIHQLIGRQPIAAFGNSDGDLAMFQWTAAGAGPRLIALVHHTDAEREFAYDVHPLAGSLVKGLAAAAMGHWTVVDIQRDWRTVFACR